MNFCSRLIVSLLLVVSSVYAGTLYNDPSVQSTTEVISSDASGITVKFNLSTLEQEKLGLNSILRIPGEGLAASPGLPDLPVIRRMIQVPSTGNMSIEILDSSKFTIFFPDNISPFQPLPVRGETRQIERIDEEFYCGDYFWPQSPTVIESVEILRDVRIARVAFSPVSWNPASRILEVTESVTVRFFADETIGENELVRPVNSLTRSYLPVYDKVVGLDILSDVVDGCYLVISSADGIERVGDLIDWKNRKGFDVVTGVIPEIGTTSAEIDAYIEEAFNTWPIPPEYILLVGDADIVPSPSYNGHAADNIYGVIGSGCVPSIHVGRLSGQDTDDLQYEAWKIVQHEMYPYEATESWFQTGVSLGHTEFTENSWDYMEYMMAAGMTPLWLCANGGVTPTVANLSEAINDGVSILGHCGHGDVTTIYPPAFDIADIAALQNGRKLPWFALVACQVGMFDGNYCFCEALMGEGSIGNARGAIGAMGPTTNSPYGAADSLVKWIFKGYFQEEVRHMGAVTDWSKNEVFNYYGSSAVDNNHMHMLFGCPEMDIYYDTAPLPLITVEHADPIVPGSSSFTVRADGTPLGGALIAVKVYDSTSGSWMNSDYTDTAGNVSFTIPDFAAASDVYVTATAFNMSPYLYQAVTSIEDTEECAVGVPTELHLGASPCTGSLSLFCSVPSGVSAQLNFFDISGRIVKTIPLDTETGNEIQAVWNGRDSSGREVPDGVYYCRLQTETGSIVKPVVMLK